MNLRLLLLPAAAILVHATASAAPVDAERRLQTAVNEVLIVANSAPNGRALAEGLRPVLRKYVSFDAMTRRAVGPGWRQFTAEQQEKAIQLFSTLVIRNYSNKFTPGSRAAVQFKAAAAPAPGRVEVPTTVLYQGSRYTVTYRLEKLDDWRITDVVIEGVSLIANYRTQFDAQFKKGGADAVITALTQSAAALK